MKVIRFLLVAFITFGLFFGLNYKWGDVPPIGKFLDPFNGFWQNAETKEVNLKSEITSADILQTVNIKYDDRLVPHIFAENNHDLYFAQGYVTAQHRLWQMETQIRFAGGRLSEVLGEKLLKVDREQRRIGMVYGAQNALEAALKNKEAKEMLESYAAGVNHYLKSLSYKNLPIEYKLLDYEPEEWTPLKTCLLLKYMAKDLAGYDNKLEKTNALRIFGKETFDLLYSDDTAPAPSPIIPSGTAWNFQPVPPPPSIEDSIPLPLTNLKITKPHPDNGSNNWAISGAKSATGSPILANDPHLGLNFPSIWYEVQLSGKGVNVYGASLPGAPGVVVGFNDSIAWGVTNSQRFVMDWYKIDFKDHSKSEYLYDSAWLKTKKVIEEIKIRGKNTFYDTVNYTLHGPVVFDEAFSKKKKPDGYALRWIAHDPSLEVLTFYYLNRAKNYNDYVNALKYYNCPSQNFVFASSSGDIALWIAGKYPVSRKRKQKFLLDGSRSDNFNQTYIPFEHSPNVLNPPRSFVASANQHPVDSTYPYFSYDGDFEYYRNRRINSVLAEKNNIAVKDFMNLQNDNYNLQASESLPYFLSNLDSLNLTAEEQEGYTLLKSWDYFNSAKSTPAIFYQAWFDTLYSMTWDEILLDTIALPSPKRYTTIKLMKTHPDHILFNIKETKVIENAKDLIRISFKESVKKVNKWRKQIPAQKYTWANYKGTTVRHLLRLNPFNSDTLIVGGYKSIVNATSDDHGPSWKMIVALGKEIDAYGVYPGGQSGNPGSPYYNNFIQTWAGGEYYKLRFIKPTNPNKEGIIFNQTIKKQ